MAGRSEAPKRTNILGENLLGRAGRPLEYVGDGYNQDGITPKHQQPFNWSSKMSWFESGRGASKIQLM
jgi:hypothetical protein